MSIIKIVSRFCPSVILRLSSEIYFCIQSIPKGLNNPKFGLYSLTTDTPYEGPFAINMLAEQVALFFEVPEY